MIKLSPVGSTPGTRPPGGRRPGACVDGRGADSRLAPVCALKVQICPFRNLEKSPRPCTGPPAGAVNTMGKRSFSSEVGRKTNIYEGSGPPGPHTYVHNKSRGQPRPPLGAGTLGRPRMGKGNGQPRATQEQARKDHDKGVKKPTGIGNQDETTYFLWGLGSTLGSILLYIYKVEPTAGRCFAAGLSEQRERERAGQWRSREMFF